MRGSLLLAAALAALCALAGAADDELVTLPRVQRKPILGRPHVFPLNGVKYNLYLNYLRDWVDRPLLHDRSLRNPAQNETLNYPEFSIQIKTGLSYSLDGFAILVGTSGMVQRYLDAVNFTDQFKPKDFYILLEFGTGGLGKDGDINDIVAYQAKALERALASPHSLRHGGKVVVASYVASGSTPAVWARILAAHRQRFGDTFLFVADVRSGLHELQEEFHAHDGKVKKTTLETARAALRAWLDVCDGIMFGGPNHMAVMPSRELDARFYEQLVAPLYAGVLTEKPYAGKMLALGAALGYTNHFSASTQHEDGTRHLRLTLETALNAGADLVVMPEWSEFNENTCVMPTIFNSFSSQRVMKFYLDRLRGAAPQPNPGDDVSIPNLIASYRRILKAGEPLLVEFLNVPDGGAGQYTVTASVLGADGSVLKTFAPASFDAARLQETRLTAATEEMAMNPVLRLRLAVKTAGGKERVFEDGMLHVRLRPSWNWNYKWAKIPLRDLLAPEKAGFAAASKAGQPGAVEARGEIRCSEPLAALEVIADDDELYAVDRLKEYPPQETHALFRVGYLSFRTLPFKGSMTVRDARFKMYPPNLYHATLKGQVWSINDKTNTTERGFILAVPREDIAKGVLDFAFNSVKETVPLARVAENGVYAVSTQDGFFLTVEDFRKLPDIPVHPDAKDASFEATVWPEGPRPVMWMRAVTKSGKVYFSKPVLLGQPSGAERINVFSMTSSPIRPVAASVDRSDLPDLNYVFSPVLGARLPTAAGRDWHGQLSGGADAGSTMRYATDKTYPKNAREAAPQWVQEDGATCLKFDGKGAIVTFPRETIPTGSFRLSFEIKPLSNKEQVLLECRTKYIGPLHLRLKNGKLQAVYRDWNLTKHAQAEFGMEAGESPDIPVGKWSKVEVTYDLKRLRIAVNGKPGKDAPLSQPGYAFSACVFGGFGGDSASYFEGYLKSFRVQHGAAMD